MDAGDCRIACSHHDRSGSRNLGSEPQADIKFKIDPSGPTSLTLKPGSKVSTVSYNSMTSFGPGLQMNELMGNISHSKYSTISKLKPTSRSQNWHSIHQNYFSIFTFQQTESSHYESIQCFQFIHLDFCRPKVESHCCYSRSYGVDVGDKDTEDEGLIMASARMKWQLSQLQSRERKTLTLSRLYGNICCLPLQLVSDQCVASFFFSGVLSQSYLEMRSTIIKDGPLSYQGAVLLEKNELIPIVIMQSLVGMMIDHSSTSLNSNLRKPNQIEQQK